MTFRKITGASVVALCVALGGAAFAQDTDMSAWDADEDMGVSEEEFIKEWDRSPAYDTYDMDTDEELTAEEVGTELEEFGGFEMFDEDGDGVITREEFGNRVFTEYDVDEDAYLDEQEFSGFQQDQGGTWERGAN